MIIRFSIFTALLFGYINALSLKEGFIKSLQNDPNVLVRQNELNKIKYDIDKARGLFYPTIDLEARAYNQRTSTDSYRPENGSLQRNDEYVVRLEQPIYKGFETINENRIQNARYESAEYYLKEEQNSLALRYVQNYLNVLKSSDLLNLSTESYNMSEDIFKKTSRKVEMGYGTKLEYERAKGNLEESSVNLSIDKLSLQDSIQYLYDNIQEEVKETDLIKEDFNYTLPKTQDKALNFALVNHPSMFVSVINIDIAKFEQKKELKSFHPELNLEAKYNLNDGSYRETNAKPENQYEIGVKLVYNLYNGGKDLANNRKMKETIKEKSILLDQTKKDIKNALALSWNSYILNQEKLKRLENFVKTREAVLDATYQEFGLGTRDLGSVVDAHLDYISTKRNYISTKYDLLLAHYRVLYSIGILSDVLLEHMDNTLFVNEFSNMNEIFTKNIK